MYKYYINDNIIMNSSIISVKKVMYFLKRNCEIHCLTENLHNFGAEIMECALRQGINLGHENLLNFQKIKVCQSE